MPFISNVKAAFSRVFISSTNLCIYFFFLQPNVGVLNLAAAGGSAGGGMLDRTRMALCAFTFFFLSLNPLAALFFSSGSRSPAEGAAPASAHPAGRTMLNVDAAGRK